ELVVAAVGRRAVRPPTAERCGMAESVALEVVEGHLAHELWTDRLPRQVLAPVPARCGARQAPALRGRGGFGQRPLAPRMVLHATSVRLEELDELGALCHRERRGHADVLEVAGIIPQAEQQRADERS